MPPSYHCTHCNAMVPRGGHHNCRRNSSLGIAPPATEKLNVSETLHDLELWLEYCLGHLEYRSTMDPFDANGSAFCAVPDWQLRQKLDNVRDALKEPSNA